jgi:DNA-binding ferritin-like protein
METRKLKSPVNIFSQKSANTPQISKSSSLDEKFGHCMSELMVIATATHKLHLRVQGQGSYAAHMALNTFYDKLPDLVDGLAESYQGVTETILDYPVVSEPVLNTVEEAMVYMKDVYSRLTELQSMLSYSEIINDIDIVKTLINSTKYKLKFLH